MIFQDAYDIAQRLLDARLRSTHQEEIVISGVEEDEKGWTFWYDTRSYLADDNISAALVGNGPVIVPKNGAPAFIGSVIDSAWQKLED